MIPRIALFLVFSLLASTTLSAERPNILYIYTDDQSHRTVSCYPEAYDWVNTPHIDALAADGIRFTRFHAAAPVCSPPRASCLPGPHPYRAGIPGANSGHLRADEFTLQGMLGKAGYRTGVTIRPQNLHFGERRQNWTHGSGAYDPDRESLPGAAAITTPPPIE